jgi:hypothetical protein
MGAFEMRGLYRHGVFLVLVGLVWAFAAACFALEWFADPYDLRFARPAARLADHPYPPDVVPRLFEAAARGKADLVIVGGSTSMGYTATMMRQAFPLARRPVNLSYSCADTDDMRQVLPLLERSPDIRRVIISIDVTLITKCVPPRSQSALDPRYYRHDWYDPAPEFSAESLALSNAEMQTHMLDLPGWRPRLPDRVEGMTNDPPLTTSPAAVAEIAGLVATTRGKVTTGPDASCDVVPAIRDVIAPFVRRMAARGVAVDIVAPPYSLGIYATWTADPARFPASPFASVMALQRCALQETAGPPNVRFHGFGADPAIVGNLGLYRDVGHLDDYATYQVILNRIAAGANVVTPAQWPAYQATLKREVDAFRV